MRVERPRATRYSFVADATLTDVESSDKTHQKTRDLSLFGCHVAPGNCAPTGTRVRVQIVHMGEIFEALGRVTNVRPMAGMGIIFTKVEERYQLVLEKWLSALRNTKLYGDYAPPITVANEKKSDP